MKADSISINNETERGAWVMRGWKWVPAEPPYIGEMWLPPSVLGLINNAI